MRATVQLHKERASELLSTSNQAERLGVRVVQILALGGAFEVETESLETLKETLTSFDAIKEILEVRSLQLVQDPQE